MSWKKRLFYSFWIFIIIMLGWQAYQYNAKISTPDPLHPTQDHFYFIHTNAHLVVVPPAPKDGPDVKQTRFTIEDNTPGTSSFTCHVTLTNVGNAKAVNVQVNVRPYRGAITGDVDVGRSNLTPMADNSPLGQLGQWVSFPDLDPGQSDTETAVFTKQSGANFGKNQPADIIFEADKKKSP